MNTLDNLLLVGNLKFDDGNGSNREDSILSTTIRLQYVGDAIIGVDSNGVYKISDCVTSTVWFETAGNTGILRIGDAFSFRVGSGVGTGGGGSLDGDLFLPSGSYYGDASKLDFSNLPTEAPEEPGRMWNDSGTLRIS